MSNLFYRIDSKNNIGVGTNQIVATNDNLIVESTGDKKTIIKIFKNLIIL